MFPDTLGVYMTLSIVYILVGMTVFTTIIEIVRQQYVSTKYLHISIHVIYIQGVFFSMDSVRGL